MKKQIEMDKQLYNKIAKALEGWGGLLGNTTLFDFQKAWQEGIKIPEDSPSSTATDYFTIDIKEIDDNNTSTSNNQ